MKELDSVEIDGVMTQEDIECCLTLLGATCVEDLLQKDVKQCLEDYKRAGIQTWMLTGDKGKTAKMIGIQCGMFTQKSSNRRVGADSSKTKAEEIVEENLCDAFQKKSSYDDELLLYEVDDKVRDVQSIIKQILKLSEGSGTGGKKKIELLIDGGIFAMMLTSDK